MDILDLTWPSPEENLACDEALLDLCDAGKAPETLRFWESPRPFVVAGYGNDPDREVYLEACQALHIPVLRRCSGGGAVLQGPGCLNYALVLKADLSGPLGGITGTNCLIMTRHRDALRTLLGRPDVEIEGHTDLVLEGRKFSGNAQRRKRRAILFHGTFLLEADFTLMNGVLKMPSRQPDYRVGRSHSGFLTTLAVGREALKAALRSIWNAQAPLDVAIADRTRALAAGKYADPGWLRSDRSRAC